MAAIGTFDTLVPRMKIGGFVATTLAAIITSKFGWSLGEDLLAKISLAGLLALCTYIVGYALVAAREAYQRNMPSVSAAAVGLFAISIFVEFLSHTGFTASNRDATAQQASMASTAYEDKRGNVKLWEDKVARLQDARSLMKPVRSAAQARATISTTEAHKLFRGATEGCKVTKGPQSRALCEDYASAQADLALWDQISLQEGEITNAQAKLEAARATAGETVAGHASGASQSAILASIATANMAPTANATYWAGVGISAILALFAIAAGGLLNFIAFAFDEHIKTASPVMTAARTKLDAIPEAVMSIAELARKQGITLRAA